jgi:hypothetical protein
VSRWIRGPAVAVAVVLLSGCAEGHSPAGTREPASYSDDIAPELRAMLPVFNAPRTAKDGLPVGSNSHALMESDAQPGERPDLSRRILVSRSAGPVYMWLWPMQAGICYAYRGGAGCADLGSLASEGIVWNARSDPAWGDRIRLGVIAHPAARDISVVREGAPAVMLRLHRGVSVTDIPRARALRWRVGDAARSARLFPAGLARGG